jgi:hypothetical protein
MADTRKIEEICAMELEIGKTAAATWSWGGSTIQALGANDGLPYVEKSIKVGMETAEDLSIEDAAFTDLPVQTGLSGMMDNFAGIVRYDGLDRLWYWMFGYEDGGDSPDDLGGGYYEHMFELDAHERHYTTYRTAEQTAGDYASTDRKNRAASFAFKRGPNDHRYAHQLCTGFTFSSSADDGLVRFTSKGIGPKEERGDYGSGTWTMPTALQGSSLDVLHRQCTVSIKPSGGAFIAYGVSAWEVNVEIPLKMDRDTESGLYLIEPVMEGGYTVNATVTLSRHSADTFPGYRDNWTECLMKIVATSGSYSFELYLPSMKIPDAAPSEDDVAQVPITFTCAKEPDITSPVFATEMGNMTMIQGGQLFLITNNTNSVNEMRRE